MAGLSWITSNPPVTTEGRCGVANDVGVPRLLGVRLEATCGVEPEDEQERELRH